MAISLIQNRSERFFFGRWMAVVYVGGELSVVEVAFRLRSVLLPDVEDHGQLWKRRDNSISGAR